MLCDFDDDENFIVGGVCVCFLRVFFDTNGVSSFSFTKNIHHVSRLLRVEEIPVSPFARRRRSPGAAVDRSARGARESTV